MALTESTLDMRFLSGKTQNTNSKVTFEEMECPPAAAWKEWKAFVYRNFISGQNHINPPLIK